MKHSRIIEILIAFVLFFLLIRNVFAEPANIQSTSVSLNIPSLIEYIKKNNADILNAADNLKFTKYQIDETKSITRPSVNFTAGYARLKDELYNSAFSSNYSYKISLQQPLFTYGQIESAIKIAEHYYKSSEKDYANTVKNITLAASKMLYTIKLLHYQREIFKASEKTFSEHCANVKARFDAGDATKVDFLNAKVNFEQIKPRIIEIDNKIQTLKNELKIMLNLDMKTEIVVTEEIKNKPEILKQFNTQDYYDKCLKGSEPLAKMNERLEILKLQKKIAHNTLRPSIGLVTSFGGVSDLPGELITDPKKNAMIGINLNFPVFDGFKSRNQVREFDVQIQTLERDISTLKNIILKNLETYASNIIQYTKQIEADMYVNEQAEEAARVTFENFQAGSSVNLDVIESEKNKLNAKISLITDNYYLLITLLDLKNLAGMELDK